MDLKAALKRQYHAALAMLKSTIDRCPDELWNAGESPRSFWRIAFHTLFYAHLYLMPKMEDFEPWEHDYEDAANLWSPPAADVTFSKAQILDYWAICDGMVDEAIDQLDLDDPACGFSWYNMPKIDHQLVNLRHINQHVGQLSERLMAAGIDSDWVGGSLPK